MRALAFFYRQFTSFPKDVENNTTKKKPKLLGKQMETIGKSQKHNKIVEEAHHAPWLLQCADLTEQVCQFRK